MDEQQPLSHLFISVSTCYTTKKYGKSRNTANVPPKPNVHLQYFLHSHPLEWSSKHGTCWKRQEDARCFNIFFIIILFFFIFFFFFFFFFCYFYFFLFCFFLVFFLFFILFIFFFFYLFFFCFYFFFIKCNHTGVECNSMEQLFAVVIKGLWC